METGRFPRRLGLPRRRATWVSRGGILLFPEEALVECEGGVELFVEGVVCPDPV